MKFDKDIFNVEHLDDHEKSLDTIAEVDENEIDFDVSTT